MAKGSTLPFAADNGRTSVIVQQTVRTMKFFNVAEHEMDALSLLNDVRLGLTSGAGILFGAGLPDAYTWAFATGSATAEGKRAVFFIVAAIVVFAASFWPGRKAKRLWTQIGTETAAQDSSSAAVPMSPSSVPSGASPYRP